MFCSEAKNFIEAACLGAGIAIPLVANIAANLIAFLSLLAFLNAALGWFGNMLNEPDLSFEVIFLFTVIAFLSLCSEALNCICENEMMFKRDNIDLGDDNNTIQM